MSLLAAAHNLHAISNTREGSMRPARSAVSGNVLVNSMVEDLPCGRVQLGGKVPNTAMVWYD